VNKQSRPDDVFPAEDTETAALAREGSAAERLEIAGSGQLIHVGRPDITNNVVISSRTAATTL
jgi:hypothetical protein